MDIGKRDRNRKVIGILINAFFLPGLGQVIVGRIVKGVELIVMAAALFFGRFLVTKGAMRCAPPEFGIGMSLIFFFGVFVVWIYALVDVITGEVKPLSGDKKEHMPASKIVGILVNLFFPGLGQVIVGRVKRGIVLISMSIIVVFWYFFQTAGFTMLINTPRYAIEWAISLGPPSPLWILVAFIVWLYALRDVIVGEVKKR